jgi:hypothetical protein
MKLNDIYTILDKEISLKNNKKNNFQVNPIIEDHIDSFKQ